MKIYIIAGISAHKEVNLIKAFDDKSAAENFKKEYENKIKNDPFSELKFSVVVFIVERNLLN